MGRIHLSIKIILAALPLLFPNSVYALELQSALSQMLESNPEVQQKRFDLISSYHDLDITRSGYLPKIDVRSSVAKERAKTLMTGFENREFSTVNTNIALTQNLFSGFMTSSDMALKRQNIQMKSYALDEKINDVSLGLIKSYLDILKARELLEVERDNVTEHQKIYQQVKIKSESGRGRGSEQKEALAKLSLCYVNTLTQDNNYNDAATVLSKYMGRYIDVKTLQKPSVCLNDIPNSLEEAISEAMQKNPSIMVSRSEAEGTQKSVDIERSSLYPKVDAELNSRSYNNASGTGNIDKTAAAMVTLSYNFYNGGSDEARIKRSLSQSSNAIERLRSVEREVMQTMAMAYNAYKVFERQKPFLELYRDANGEKTRFYHEEFDLGHRSLIDLLDSENEYSTARRKSIENEYELLYSYFKILAAKNELISFFRLDVPNHSATVTNDPSINEVIKEAPSVSEYAPISLIAPQILPREPESTMTNAIVAVDQNVSKSIDQNAQKGYMYYLKAARLGDKESQLKVAMFYEQGIGTVQDATKAAYWKNRFTQREKGGNLKEAHSFKVLGEQCFYPQKSLKPQSVPHAPTLPASTDEKAKTLGERLKELGIM